MSFNFYVYHNEAPHKNCLWLNGPPRLSICHQRAVVHKRFMLAHCNLKQNMCLHSKQSGLFSFYSLPSGVKSKDVVVHWSYTDWSFSIGVIRFLRSALYTLCPILFICTQIESLVWTLTTTISGSWIFPRLLASFSRIDSADWPL